MWKSEGILGMTWKPVILTGIRVEIATVRIGMRRKKHCKQMMNQCRMWRTQSIVLESVNIERYISDL